MPAGKARKPERSTVGTKEAGVAKATSWPACIPARAIGTSGWKCPNPAVQVKRIRMI
jgi:hypothetical protein